MLKQCDVNPAKVEVRSETNATVGGRYAVSPLKDLKLAELRRQKRHDHQVRGSTPSDVGIQWPICARQCASQLDLVGYQCQHNVIDQ